MHKRTLVVANVSITCFNDAVAGQTCNDSKNGTPCVQQSVRSTRALHAGVWTCGRVDEGEVVRNARATNGQTKHAA